MRSLTQKAVSRALNTLGMGPFKRDLAGLRLLLERSAGGTVGTADKVSQLVLANQYRALARGQAPLPSFDDTEFGAFSQNGEDGILLYVFSLPGMGGRRCVEICAGDGIERNAVFVADGIGEDVLPEVSVESCLDRPFVARASRKLLPKVAHLDWIDV
jgi:hypothetical protein